MPQSFAAVYVHVVFSTKQRLSAINPTWSQRLFDYIGGIVVHRGGSLLASGGMPDHVHLLVSLGREWSLADLLRDIKAGSSKWVHDQFPAENGFAWQSGYGAFSVSHSNLDMVTAYISDQPKHHQAKTYQEELRTLLTKHGLTWDERYIWD
jgi:REP element-mobilizing transposase RayT